MLVAKSSGALTSSTLLKTGPGLLSGVIVVANGTNEATITIYDNTSAAGTKIFEAQITTPKATPFPFPIPVNFKIGAYVAISGTGAGAFVYIV
jgi:hypothetical protein